jgi:hypothetical protein
MVRFFILNIYRTHGPLDIIVLNRGPQFISEFWAELYYILGIKLKLLIVYYL